MLPSDRGSVSGAALKAAIRAILGLIAFGLAAAPSHAKDDKVPTGYVVFSIESDNRRESAQAVTVRRHGTAKTWHIATPGFLGTKYHFETPTGPGSVIVKELPQGDYVADTIWISIAGSEGTAVVQVPFVVDGGKATYLGAFRPKIWDRKGWFGGSIPNSVSYRLYDERARDLPLAAPMLPAGTETLENFGGYAE